MHMYMFSLLADKVRSFHLYFKANRKPNMSLNKFLLAFYKLLNILNNLSIPEK